MAGGQLQFVDLEGTKEPSAPPAVSLSPPVGPIGASPSPEWANLNASNSGSLGPGGGAPATSASVAVAGAAATAAAGTAGAIADFFRTARNPKVCAFHVLFKVAALLAYFVGRHLLNHYVVTFIMTVVLCAFDFWTVKNITGRLLVGMRWWNDIKEDGSSQWYFESIADESTIDPKDRSIFWGALYVWPVLWLIFLILNFISFTWDWLLLIIMVFVFAVANVVGYWKCSKDQKRQMAEWAKSQAVHAVVSNWF